MIPRGKGGDCILATSLAAIEKLLADMRYAIDNQKCTPIRRKPNMDTLARLGITWSDAFDKMYELTSADYIKGPEDDRNEPTTDKVWVFKKHAYGAVL